MSTKHAPATPLPWHRYNQDRGSIHFGCALETITGDDDLDFAIHACNAYPKLIETLKGLIGEGITVDAVVTEVLTELGELDSAPTDQIT